MCIISKLTDHASHRQSSTPKLSTTHNNLCRNQQPWLGIRLLPTMAILVSETLGSGPVNLPPVLGRSLLSHGASEPGHDED